jgi:hypothetical protein
VKEELDQVIEKGREEIVIGIEVKEELDQVIEKGREGVVMEVEVTGKLDQISKFDSIYYKNLILEIRKSCIYTVYVYL